MVAIGEPARIIYTNYRGETSERTITPKRVWYGISDWHSEPQWFVTAFDHDKNADRDFALCDFGHSTSPNTREHAWEEDRAEQFIQAAIDTAPEPLRRLGEWLAYKLDDDEWKTADRLITGAAVSLRALHSAPDQADAVKPDEGDGVHSAAISNLIEAAKEEAAKAMRKFPQPNYVISKLAEEAGEVVKAAIHCAEGRENPEAVISEIKQTFAMLFRLLLEGDGVHGLSPLLPSAQTSEA
ncbi:hypothetical protein [Brucella intermedia]|uniref:hypothetical protein n=1 Tax=Brucella intermedia TaxID=94625 RepID=UPI001AEC288F|nr:hypothetical protein [Brucella intermedia]